MDDTQGGAGHGKQYGIQLVVNGDLHSIFVKANTLLVNVLRDRLNLTGTKKGCELGIAVPARYFSTGNRSTPAWCWQWRPTAMRSPPWKG